MKDDIVELDTDLYLVHGRVIGCLDPGLFNADTPEGRAVLVSVADNMCGHSMCPKRHELLTVFLFRKVPKITGGRYLLANQKHFMELSDNVKVILRQELPEYANKF